MKKLKMLFIIFLAAFALTAITSCKQKTEEDGIRNSLPKEGDPAGIFLLKLFDGREFKLDEAKGRPVLINFWASWCRPCKAEAPLLQKTYEKYRDRGIVFTGIAVQDTESKAKGFIQEFKIAFQNGLDSDGVIAEKYRIYGIPKTFIINKEGMISYIHMGEVTELELWQEIEKVL